MPTTNSAVYNAYGKKKRNSLAPYLDAGNSSAGSAHLLHSLYANTGIESIQTITERFSMTGCRSSLAAELLHNLKI